MVTALLALMLTAAPDNAGALRLWVQTEPSALRTTLAPRLRAELPAEASLISVDGDPSTADLRIDVQHADDQISFTIMRADGAGRQARSFATHDGINPALRLGIRVITERVAQAIRLHGAGDDAPADNDGRGRTSAKAEDAPSGENRAPVGKTSANDTRAPPGAPRTDGAAAGRTAGAQNTPTGGPESADNTPTGGTSGADVPPPVTPDSSKNDAATTADSEADNLRWIASAQIGLLWWARPSGGELGAELGLAYRWRAWRVGVRGGVYGVGCCGFEADNVQGDVVVGIAMAELQRELFRYGPARLSVAAAAGLTVERVSVDPVGFAGDTRRQTVQAASPAGRLTLAIDVSVTDRLLIGARVDGLLRTARLRLRLPAPFEGENPDIDAGPFVPMASAIATLSIF